MAIPARLSLASCTFSDSDKLEYEPGTDSTRARLKLIEQWTDTFTTPGDFGHLTEVDSAANVDVSGGTLNVQGNNAFNANGAYLTSLVSVSTPGRFTIELTPTGVPDVRHVTGIAAAAALSWNDGGLKAGYELGSYFYCVTTNTVRTAAGDFAAGTKYTLEYEWDADKSMRIYITGGIFTSRTFLFAAFATGLGATIGFQINAYASAAEQHAYDNFKLEQGYATDSPTCTLADVDGGADNATWDMSTIAFAGSTTNLTFKYAYGNTANPTNWSSALTYAQLITESDPSGRYFRLQVIAASDGATQVEITEGTINVSPGKPTAPDIAVAWLSSTSVRVTFSNSASGVTNYILYALSSDGGDTWSLFGTSRSGDGTIDVTGLSEGGIYDFVGYSMLNGCRSDPSNVVDDFTVIAAASTKPTVLISRKQRLVQTDVLSEDRDEKITQYTYALPTNATLASHDLEPGDTIPGNSSAIILSSRLKLAPGASEKLAVVVAREMRANDR